MNCGGWTLQPSSVTCPGSWPPRCSWSSSTPRSSTLPFPRWPKACSVTPLSLKAVVTSYVVSLAVCIPASGWMADRFGTRRVFMLAVGIFTCASVLCGLALSAPMLVATRVLQGIGAAMMTPVGRLAIVQTFPKSELLRAQNFVIIPALIGPMLGPTVGGLIVHWMSWREIFFVNVPVGLVALYLIHRYMPDYRAETQAAARRHRPGPVRLRRGAAFVAAGSVRRAHDRPHVRRHPAADFHLPAGGVRVARARKCLPAAAPRLVQDAHVPRVGCGRLCHAAGYRRPAVPAAPSLPARPGIARLAIGPADDACGDRRHGHEVLLGARAAPLRIPPGADCQHGAHRRHDRAVCAGYAGHADGADHRAWVWRRVSSTRCSSPASTRWPLPTSKPAIPAWRVPSPARCSRCRWVLAWPAAR